MLWKTAQPRAICPAPRYLSSPMRIYPVPQETSQIHLQAVITPERPRLPALSPWQSTSTCQRGPTTLKQQLNGFLQMLPFLLCSVVEVCHTNQNQVSIRGSVLGLSILFHWPVCGCVGHTLSWLLWLSKSQWPAGWASVYSALQVPQLYLNFRTPLSSQTAPSFSL